MELSSNHETYDHKVEAGFQKILNRHGYGFHYSVLKLASDLYASETSEWAFEAAEFPVMVQSCGTRIDFILQHKRIPSFYLLAECKRANPALSNWCFARAPLVRRNRSNEMLFLEYFGRSETMYDRQDMWAYSKEVRNLSEAYHIAMEVKSDKKGDWDGKGRGAIEEAVTQICRGVGGMVEFLGGNPQVLGKATEAHFLPVVFTTAQIWVSDVDLSTADYRTGDLDFNDTKFSHKDYIFYQYHLSPGLKHSYSLISGRNIGDYLDSGYVRTISVVSASGIEDFLSWSSSIDVHPF